MFLGLGWKQAVTTVAWFDLQGGHFPLGAAADSRRLSSLRAQSNFMRTGEVWLWQYNDNEH